MFSQLLKIVEEILEWVHSTKKAALSVDLMAFMKTATSSSYFTFRTST
ncbi:MAG: hypothetical protein J6Y99_06470 [Bacteroidales bacterium]|nr:hypothetical protein [Bacteroidales bacterium]